MMMFVVIAFSVVSFLIRRLIPKLGKFNGPWIKARTEYIFYIKQRYR